MLELPQSGLDITLTIRMGDTRRAPNSNRSGWLWSWGPIGKSQLTDCLSSGRGPKVSLPSCRANTLHKLLRWGGC